MRAASLRLPITFVTTTPVSDGAGGVASTSDTTVIAMMARQLSSREAERYTGQQLEGVTRRVYEIRYYAGLTTAMSVLHGSDRLRVIGIEDPDEGRKRRLLVTCELRAGAA